MVCAYVREDSPRALASGLSPVHTHNHTKMPYCTSMHHACAISQVSHFQADLFNCMEHFHEAS